jgi:DNA-directed RNA polymerase specialized sigma24 family protein
MELRKLLWHCATETERYYRGEAHDTSYSFEVFRRALVERNEAAWEHVYTHYRGLVERWIRRSNAFVQSGEACDYFVTGAFVKFWQALTPERFASFTCVAALLQYLRLCATSVVIDTARNRSWRDMLPEEAADGDPVAVCSPDEEALERVAGEEFWSLINGMLNSPQERAVVYDSFVLDLTPRAIFARRQNLFASVEEIYVVKRNVMNRLERQPMLRQLAGL